MCALVFMIFFTCLSHYQFQDENKIDVYFELPFCPLVRASRDSNSEDRSMVFFK